MIMRLSEHKLDIRDGPILDNDIEKVNYLLEKIVMNSELTFTDENNLTRIGKKLKINLEC